MEKKSLVLILILCLANQSLAGALVPRYAAKPQINIFEQFWEKMNNFVTGGLHLVGSILPLRGLATIAKDLGFPHADSILDALTPTKRIPSRVNTRFFEITRCLIIKTEHIKQWHHKKSLKKLLLNYENTQMSCPYIGQKSFWAFQIALDG